MAVLHYPPTQNGLQKTLDAQLDEGVTASMTLNNTTGVQNEPGVVLINRITSGGAEQSAAVREWVEYTGVSGNTLTGLTRGKGGSTDQDHAVGQVVEFAFDVTQAQSYSDALANLVDPSTLAVDTTKVVTPAGTQTLTNKTLTSPTINSGTLNKPTVNGSLQALTSDSDGATITFDMAASNIHTVTLGGNRILALSNVSVGQPFVIRLVQDDPGSRTVTWFSTIKWAGGSAPTLTTTANKIDVFGFLCTSSGNYDGFIVGQNL
jgi:hypothetical protein